MKFIYWCFFCTSRYITLICIHEQIDFSLHWFFQESIRRALSIDVRHMSHSIFIHRKKIFFLCCFSVTDPSFCYICSYFFCILIRFHSFFFVSTKKLFSFRERKTLHVWLSVEWINSVLHCDFCMSNQLILYFHWTIPWAYNFTFIGF